MAIINGVQYTKEELLKKCGTMAQVAGFKRYIISEGRGKGIEAIDVNNGNGLQFTVLLDKCLDIGSCSYNGINLAYATSNGLVAPQFYDSHGAEWLRTFNGGLLSTCGITHCGVPGEDGGEQLGLHGRISNCPADHICCEAAWEGDEYVITIKGRSYESRLHGEYLELRRTIKVYTGKNTIYLHDEVENKGYRPEPLMMIYHCNFGFPLYDAGSKIHIDSVSCEPNDEFSANKMSSRDLVTVPQHLEPESVYFHTMNTLHGYGFASLFNHKLNNSGLGMSMKYNLDELPYMNQWKMVAEGHYVLGLEPANCRTLGRAHAKETGMLRYIQPGETRHFDIEFTVIEDASALNMRK